MHHAHHACHHALSVGLFCLHTRSLLTLMHIMPVI